MRQKLFLLFLMPLGCSWAEKKASLPEHANQFHKTIRFEGATPENCPAEYKISRIQMHTQDVNLINILAIKDNCLLFFSIQESKDISNPENKFSCVKTRIFHNGHLLFESENRSEIKLSDIGWGFRLVWISETANKKYSFHLRMKAENDEKIFQ